MRAVVLVSLFACACGAIAVDPPHELAPDGGDASVDSGISHAPAPEPPSVCRPAPDATESTEEVAIPPGVTADFAVRGGRPVIAVTSNGDAVVAWHEADHVRVRLYRDSRWLDVETISAPDSRFVAWDQVPKVAIRPDGTVVVAYYERANVSHDVVCTRERSSTGTWSAVSTLAVTGIGWWQEPSPPVFELGADGAGNITAVVDADSENGGLLAFRAPAGGRFGDPVSLTSVALWDFSFAMSESGEAIAVWPEGSVADGLANAAMFSPATGWSSSAPLDLGQAGLSAAPEPDGAMSVLGVRYFEDGGTRVQTAMRSRDGNWSARTEHADFPASYARIASDGVGNVMVAGSSWSSDCMIESGVMRRDASGKWGAAEVIPGTPPGKTTIGAVALSHSGHGLVAWEEETPSSGVRCVSAGAYLSWLSPDGSWLAPLLLDAKGDSAATLALTPSGRALVAWSHGDLVLVRWIDAP